MKWWIIRALLYRSLPAIGVIIMSAFAAAMAVEWAVDVYAYYVADYAEK
jgi:hypothetical protein